MSWLDDLEMERPEHPVQQRIKRDVIRAGEQFWYRVRAAQLTDEMMTDLSEHPLPPSRVWSEADLIRLRSKQRLEAFTEAQLLKAESFLLEGK